MGKRMRIGEGAYFQDETDRFITHLKECETCQHETTKQGEHRLILCAKGRRMFAQLPLSGIGLGAINTVRAKAA